MKYLAMIFTDESTETSISPEEEQAMMAEYGQFMQDAQAAGVVQGGERLRPTSAATTVRVQSGEVLTTDGPYTETKEQLGGYFILDCADLDDAIAWAARIPGARHGAIEVRPIWE